MSGYIGTQPVPQATQTRDSFTATSGQTSFATGGYTPNFLDVYLNGVKLASADYTATNGSDVVLASGAATGDILEVVAFTTFNSASSSIDDNGNATAITIDSSENVLIGQSTSNFATKGIRLRGDVGQMTATRDGGSPIGLNRLTSDGSILDFSKDGTTVGSVGVAASDNLYIAGGSGSTKGLYFNDSGVVPANTGGAPQDNASDLGAPSVRFRNAYLSGGVYLGGTGSANKLDDFETGSFTPVLDNVTCSYSAQTGTYTKVGNLVTARFEIGVTGLNTGDGSGFQIGNLPFVCGASGVLFTMDTENSNVITNKQNVLGARPIVSANGVRLTDNGGEYAYNNGTSSSGSLIAMVQYFTT